MGNGQQTIVDSPIGLSFRNKREYTIDIHNDMHIYIKMFIFCENTTTIRVLVYVIICVKLEKIQNSQEWHKWSLVAMPWWKGKNRDVLIAKIIKRHEDFEDDEYIQMFTVGMVHMSNLSNCTH